jgi:hypothetical protein
MALTLRKKQVEAKEEHLFTIRVGRVPEKIT